VSNQAASEFSLSKLRWLAPTLLCGAIASTLLLIYASLVPLKYTPVSWEETQTRWKSIEWLSLGIGNRADWIANALVVMPSAFLFSGTVDYRRKSRWSLILLGPVIFLFLAAIVLWIELVQVWFPPRTVSQNDIFAGWVGAAVGIGAWAIFGRWMAFALEYFVSLDSTLSRIRWILGVLCLASIVYTVYPLDFVFSAEEFSEKVATGRIRLGIAFADFVGLENIKATILSFGKLLPFGLWLGLSRRGPFPWIVIPLLSIALETVQIPIFSKFATSRDVVASIFGGWSGWVVARLHSKWTPWLNREWIWNLSALGWSLALVGIFNLRFTSILQDDREITNRWNEFFTAPLLRYYYTSEYSALSNLAGKLGMFGVLGILLAIAGWIRKGSCSSRRFCIGLAWTFAISVVIELMQIYLPPLIPDASDVGIYSTGFALGYVVTAIVLGKKS
jgi:VanZ family protein